MKPLRNTVIENIIPMGTKPKPKDIELRKEWTNPYGVKCKESAIPLTKPSYEDWIRELHINEVTYQYHPDARTRAEEISGVLGIKPEPTIMDQILGRDVIDPERFS